MGYNRELGILNLQILNHWSFRGPMAEFLESNNLLLYL